MAKVPGLQVDEGSVPLRLTVAQYRALQATDRGEVFRTRSSISNTLTGPCGSVPLWALARAELIADPPNGAHHGQHRMILTTRGREALVFASSRFEPEKKP